MRGRIGELTLVKGAEISPFPAGLKHRRCGEPGTIVFNTIPKSLMLIVGTGVMVEGGHCH